MSHNPTKNASSSYSELNTPFTPKIIEYVKALGSDIVERYGGYGNLSIEIFRGEVIGIQINANLKKDYQF